MGGGKLKKTLLNHMQKGYEVVMEERKNEDAYLVTGNIKHFPIRPYIVTPREMLDIILEEN